MTEGSVSPVPLTDLPVGSTAVVEGLEGEPSFQKRLADLGLIPGISIRFIRKAPFGDPIEIELRGYRLAIRKADAQKILVVS